LENRAGCLRKKVLSHNPCLYQKIPRIETQKSHSQPFTELRNGFYLLSSPQTIFIQSTSRKRSPDGVAGDRS